MEQIYVALASSQEAFEGVALLTKENITLCYYYAGL
jgi:hypothetical protein